ncbi:hypothetical protein [Armatimonas rosea]|uniref:Uncharacterized protein n=1 Tax=Armatimonas rosea TaxID=685828 RepID=A0A7W9SNJ4_ARMRO|nr:hypothetical protein [Armatimonas rosea]MBB6049108.1 hypothetical protein [Armatimonas rosea]
MSTLTQRFLTELDSEWSHLPMPERQSLRERIASRLEALTLAERELGASEAEAQQRAVRAVGQECTLQPQTPIRLAPVWQVTLIWIALVSFVPTLLRVFLPMKSISFQGSMALQSNWLVPALVGVVGATLCAALWHPRAARRGILNALVISTGLTLLGTLFMLVAPTPNGISEAIKYAVVQSNVTFLVAEIGLSLGTLALVQKLRGKKLSKAL